MKSKKRSDYSHLDIKQYEYSLALVRLFQMLQERNCKKGINYVLKVVNKAQFWSKYIDMYVDFVRPQYKTWLIQIIMNDMIRNIKLSGSSLLTDKERDHLFNFLKTEYKIHKRKTKPMTRYDWDKAIWEKQHSMFTKKDDNNKDTKC